MTNEEFKKTLWDAAKKLRGSVSAAQYKYPVLALIFLKYISDMFNEQKEAIKRRLADPTSEIYIEDEELRGIGSTAFTEDRNFYAQDNVFWVPAEAMFDELLKHAASADFPQMLDKAMKLIEDDNAKSLKGVLYKEFSRLELEPGKLGELANIIARIKFSRDAHESRDVFGEVYEYFLGKFALSEGARAGEFYTPQCVVKLLVDILAPFKGTIYDPACGSGGMFVQSMRFKEAHARKTQQSGDLPIYGQELMAHTRRLCLMNLAVHGLEGNLGETFGSTFTNDQHKTLRADYILANPPFNIGDWDGDKLKDDVRWKYGVPPASNANYAWLQHMLARLSNRGRAGIVLANGSTATLTSGEGEIRRSMIEGDVVECMIGLPSQLFANAAVPACLWFFSHDKNSGANGNVDRRGSVLFIDARKFASLIPGSKKQKALSEDEIRRVSQAYHNWRGTQWSEGVYDDVPGFCRSVSLAEIAENGHVLTPGRYVRTEEVDDDDEAFDEKIRKLAQKLGEQMAEGAELDSLIRQRLEGLGYAP